MLSSPTKGCTMNNSHNSIEELDPYQTAEQLVKMAIDLGSDTLSMTINDVSKSLVEAAHLITHLADESNHYRLKTQVVINVNGTDLMVDQAVVDKLFASTVQNLITNALNETPV